MRRILLVLSFFPVACHRSAPVKSNADVKRDVKDTTRVVTVFKAPAVTSVAPAGARTFKLQVAAQRDALRATLRKERNLWRANDVRDYQFLLRVDCFCPGTRGWLLMEVRNGKLLRASDGGGKSAALNDWNTLSIDALFDHLERAVDIDGVVQIAFDPGRHFPAYVSTVVLPGPDRWSVVEARELREIP